MLYAGHQQEGKNRGKNMQKVEDFFILLEKITDSIMQHADAEEEYDATTRQILTRWTYSLRNLLGEVKSGDNQNN